MFRIMIVLSVAIFFTTCMLNKTNEQEGLTVEQARMLDIY